jgi:hypothetical protein
MKDLFADFERNRKIALGYASELHLRLVKEIRDFEKGLSADEEIGGLVASFGREVQIRIDDVSWHNPYFLIFDGRVTNTNQRVRLVQHTSQLSVLFVALPKVQPGPAKRIGFTLAGEEAEG